MNNNRILLTLKYTALMSAVLIVSLIIVYLMSDHARHTAFRHTLRSEAITKANLFLEHRVDAETMQHIYLNNTQFINEVEVAVYTPGFVMLYHDAAQHDIVKETQGMIAEICEQGEMDLEVEEGYQAVGILYKDPLLSPLKGDDTSRAEKSPFKGDLEGLGFYIITAAAHDGYGEANILALRHTLFIILIVSVVLMLVIGYILATMTIRPIERALNSQKMLVSNVSHELRTPLASIIGELDLAIQRQRTPEDYQQRIANALSDAHRMSGIIVGLLNMARAEYDKSQIKMELIRIDELLMEVRENLLRANSRYNININYDDSLLADDADEALSLRANQYLLSLALRNLMENNCKYSDNQTSNITISMKDNRIALTFTDNGIGMTVAEQRSIFKPFFRGNHLVSEGHGIGMALAQRIITLHGGKIQVISKEGYGTTFLVCF